MIQELTAGIPYTVDTGEKLVNETFGPNNIRRRKTGTHELMPMSVRNGRLLTGQLALRHVMSAGDGVGSKKVGQVHSHQLLSGVAGHRLYGFVNGRHVAREIQREDDIIGIFDQFTVTLLTFS